MDSDLSLWNLTVINHELICTDQTDETLIQYLNK